jgi:glutamate racemase
VKIDLSAKECYIPQPASSSNDKHCGSEMVDRLKILPLLFSIVLICPSCPDNPAFAQQENLDNFFRKKDVTIAVTDSGLGGLSILAEAVDRSRTWKVFNRIDFIFFNSLFSNQGGYNSLASHEEKVSVFDSALRSLENHLHPDIILIGCNTLSSLYEETTFAEGQRIPVKGIIEAGVEMASFSLKAHPEAKIILFGTQTTVSEKSHQERLMKKGFLPERIVYQACPDLVNYIESGYQSAETEMLIYAYVEEALKKLGSLRSPLLVSLNCTHYGYSYDLWAKSFKSHGIEPAAILNPNSRMIDFLFPSEFRNRFDETKISIRVISMVEIEKKKRDSLGHWLRRISPQTAEALENYELNEELFEWKGLIKDQRRR